MRSNLLVPDGYKVKERLLIVGSGGHAGVVVEAIGDQELIFGLLDEFEKIGTAKHGRTVIQEPAKLDKFKVHVAIGDNIVRKRISETERFSERLVSIIHPIGVAMRAQMGKGCFIAAGAIVGNGSELGDGVIVNTHASVDHNCIIGDFAHIGPGVSIGGGVHIGSMTWIGIGACVRDHISIGANTIIGMGSVVTKDIPDNVVAYGNPCRVIRQCV